MYHRKVQVVKDVCFATRTNLVVPDENFSDRRPLSMLPRAYRETVSFEKHRQLQNITVCTSSEVQQNSEVI